MKMKTRQLLVEDIEMRKRYPAFVNCTCQICGSAIFKGEEFVYIGDKKRMCNSCVYELMDELEED